VAQTSLKLFQAVSVFCVSFISECVMGFSISLSVVLQQPDSGIVHL